MSNDRITFTPHEHHQDIIDDARDEQGVDSKAAAVRYCIENYAELQQEVENLQQHITDLNDDIDDLETEIQEQKQERRLILQELVHQGRAEQVESAEHIDIETPQPQSKQTVGLLTRVKNRLFGLPTTDDDDTADDD